MLGYDPTTPDKEAHDLTITTAITAYGNAVAYPLATMFPKLSVCALYLRIFETRWSRLVTWGAIVFIAANGISFFVATVLICNPPSVYWNEYVFPTKNRNTKPGQAACIDSEALSLAINPPNIASDLVLLILPLPIIWRLHAGRAKKVGLTITLFTGSLYVICLLICRPLRFWNPVAQELPRELPQFLELESIGF